MATMNRFLELNKSLVLTILMASLAGPFIWILKPFWLTIIMGLVFSISLSPVLSWLERRMRTTSHWALLLMLVGLTMIVVVPFALVLLKGTQALWMQSQKYSTHESLEVLKIYKADLLTRLAFLKGYGIDSDSIQDTFWTAAQKIGAVVTDRLGDTLTQIPEFILMFFVLFLSIISFLMMRRDADKRISGITWISPQGRTKLVGKFLACCRSVVVSTVVTGAIQATLTAIGAWIFTSNNVLLIFFITFVLSFVPIIGASPVSLVMAAVAFLNGEIGNGIGLSVFFAVIAIADNIIRPWLLAGSTQIPSIWALFCTIGAVVTFGLPGLFLGPLIGALTIELIPILADEYQK
jgi:predicted PurR-regulated permease PerM